MKTIDEQRTEFETWAAPHLGLVRDSIAPDRYLAPMTEGAWIAWQEQERRYQNLERQRDQAWRTLARIEAALGTADEAGLAFILAGATGPTDCEEWDRVTTTEEES